LGYSRQHLRRHAADPTTGEAAMAAAGCDDFVHKLFEFDDDLEAVSRTYL
jgi:hypothetical protein